MDPHANLMEQLDLARKIQDADDVDPSDADRLAELVIALNDWLKGGGFLPGSWQVARERKAVADIYAARTEGEVP